MLPSQSTMIFFVFVFVAANENRLVTYSTYNCVMFLYVVCIGNAA